MTSTNGSDVIELRGLRALGVIGVCPEERERPQPFELDLDLHVDVSAAGISDDLDDTVDYGRAIAAAERVVREESHLLLEKVSQRVADDVLALDERITGVRVVIRKLRPPVPQDISSTAVAITRWRAR